MHEFIAWAGFVGGWLLVAGPIYQASIELEEESISRDDFAAKFEHVPPPRVSPWWWLLPPVAFVLTRSRGRAHRDALTRSLSKTDAERLVRYSGKATGWAYVAGGAALIATKETWELAEVYAWPAVVFWVLIPIMVVAAAGNTVLRVRRGHETIAMARGSEEVTS